MNRLADETSPYLLQHADNPVDWYPWGDEALELATRENRPILLSIGYSACHWCHVMAHESFENADIAAVMNRLFVNIKVDREERPDLDKIYQAAHHLMMQRPGGWPLTVFLDPENHRPFFAGTYFPDQPRHGMPGFAEVLERVAEYYRDNRSDIRDSGQALVAALDRLDASVGASRDALDAEPLAEARRAIAGQVDRDHGGVGGAPKFPHTTSFERLLRHWRGTANDPEPDVEALYLTALTLTRMAEGGLYDHLGGGFCRYTVDATWTIPHFEKMLYDNGPLLALYAQLWTVSADDLYRRVTNETADWVLREMTAPEGGFYATLDADSEGEEGRFYVWTPDEVRAIVTEDEYAALAPHFGLDRPANFEGRWHLRVCQDIAAVASTLGRQESEIRRLVDQGRARLKAVRDQRIWPGRDEKILTAWNGLMIRGLSIAGRALRRDDLGEAAGRAIDFIRHAMVIDGRLMAVCKDGRARFNAYLDDYAFLLDGVIESLQSNWNTEHLQFACWLADQLIERFQDADGGGFFFTSHDHEQLIHRSRPMSDDSTPSGNGIAAQALGRLGHLLGDRRYLDAATGTLQAGWAEMERFPHGHTALLAALEETLHPPTVIIIRGAPEDMRQWSETVNAVFAPRRMTFAIPVEAPDLPEALAVKSPGAGTTAYVCRGTACTAPLDSLQALAREIAES